MDLDYTHALTPARRLAPRRQPISVVPFASPITLLGRKEQEDGGEARCGRSLRIDRFSALLLQKNSSTSAHVERGKCGDWCSGYGD
jgi:hypothetical protein